MRAHRIGPVIASTMAPKKPSEGAIHDIECTGSGFYGKGCKNLVSTWLPKKIPNNFATRKFFCGYCTAKNFEDQQVKIEALAKQNSDLIERIENLEQNLDQNSSNETTIPSSINDAITLDNIKQGNLQNVIRITSVPEAENENIVEKVRKVAAAMEDLHWR